MRIISATIGPLAAASATAIAASQSGTANTALTLTASPYTLDFPRRIAVVSTATESGTFAVIGTDWNNQPVTETISGVTSTAVQSVYDYSKVISITPSANTSGNISVGTNGVGSSRPIFLDEWGFSPTAIQVNISGTANATVQQSLDNPNSVGYTKVTWINHPDLNLVNLTSTVQGNYAYAPKVVRLLLNSGSGSATILLNQSASAPF